MARTIAKDYEEKRRAILRNAALFFAGRGYDRSSMNQLAKACGVSKALIYHYYNSKNALLFDIVDSHLTTLLETIKAVDISGPDAAKNLRAIVHAILSAYREADAEHQVQTEAMAALPDFERRLLADKQRQIVAIVAEALRAVSPDIYAKKPERLHPVTMSLFGMVNWFYMWHRPEKGLSRAQYGDLVTDLILTGVNGLQDI